jgi:hypothetical protein
MYRYILSLNPYEDALAQLWLTVQKTDHKLMNEFPWEYLHTLANENPIFRCRREMVLEPHKSKDEWIHGHDPFYRPSVKALNYILSVTSCEIVMTSGWRRFFDFEQINEIFRWNGIQKGPIGFTQDRNDDEKQLSPGKEIEMLRCRDNVMVGFA